jgi:hypothetical protein
MLVASEIFNLREFKIKSKWMEVHDYGCVGQIEVASNTSWPAFGGLNHGFDDGYSEAKKRSTRSVTRFIS